jgi:hypothetical protein
MNPNDAQTIIEANSRAERFLRQRQKSMHNLELVTQAFLAAEELIKITGIISEITKNGNTDQLEKAAAFLQAAKRVRTDYQGFDDQDIDKPLPDPKSS